MKVVRQKITIMSANSILRNVLREVCGAFLAAFALVFPTDCGAEAAAKPLEFADPFVLAYDGTYYAYGTGRPNGIPVAVSRDLRR